MSTEIGVCDEQFPCDAGPICWACDQHRRRLAERTSLPPVTLWRTTYRDRQDEAANKDHDTEAAP